jgi:hypothetical protein
MISFSRTSVPGATGVKHACQAFGLSAVPFAFQPGQHGAAEAGVGKVPLLQRPALHQMRPETTAENGEAQGIPFELRIADRTSAWHCRLLIGKYRGSGRQKFFKIFFAPTVPAEGGERGKGARFGDARHFFHLGQQPAIKSFHVRR